MIIAPILMEVVRRSDHRVSLFSGIAFDVDRERGLNGACDFLLARSRESFYLSHPVVAVVEAKREEIVGGLGPLVAAQLFNVRAEKGFAGSILGAVTTGNNWRFLKPDGSTASIDRREYDLDQVGKILGILLGAAV